MTGDGTPLTGIYRFTSIARPVDPAFPTNRALLFVLPGIAVVNAAIAGLTDIGGDVSSAALGGVLVAFVAWALTRELAPDDNAAAFLALAIAWPLDLFLGAGSVLLAFTTLFLVRIVNRSTGLAARPFDTLSVLGLAIWTSYSLQLPFLLVVAALAFAADARFKDPQRLHYLAAAICLAAFAWPGFGSAAPAAPAADWLLFATIAIAGGFVMATTDEAVSICDVRPERLDIARVRAGLGIGLLVGAQLLLTSGSSAWVSTPLFACLAAVPVSAGMHRLLKLRPTL